MTNAHETICEVKKIENEESRHISIEKNNKKLRCCRVAFFIYLLVFYAVILMTL